MTEEQRLADLDAEIASREQQINPLLRGLEVAKMLRRECYSRLMIAKLGIRKSMVQLSSGDDMPWHGTICGFRGWLADTCNRKPYYEWNGHVIAHYGQFSDKIQTGLLIEHVPE